MCADIEAAVTMLKDEQVRNNERISDCRRLLHVIIATDGVAWSVYLSVCLSVSHVRESY